MELPPTRLSDYHEEALVADRVESLFENGKIGQTPFSHSDRGPKVLGIVSVQGTKTSKSRIEL